MTWYLLDRDKIEEDNLEFNCPECTTTVSVTDSKCPGCEGRVQLSVSVVQERDDYSL